MSLPRVLLLIVAALALGVSIWFGMSTIAAEVDAVGIEGRTKAPGGGGERSVPGTLQHAGPQLHADDTVDDAERVAAGPDSVANAEQVVVRGFVVDDLGSPVRTFTLELTRYAHMDLGEVPEGEIVDIIMDGQFAIDDKPLVARRTQTTFDDGTGAFEILVPLGSKLELLALADGHGPDGEDCMWTTAPLSLLPEAEVELSEVQGVPAHALTSCLPQHPPTLRLVLSREGWISGRVVTPTGPVGPGATVRVNGDGNLKFSCDDEGNFSITLTGEVQFVAHHDDWVAGLPVEVDLRPGQRTHGMRLMLRSGGRLTGVVMDTDGNALAGEIMVEYAGGPGPKQNREDVDTLDGNFVFEKLVPGKYVVRFEPEMGEDSEFLDSLEHMILGDAEILEGETTHIILGGLRTDTIRLHGLMTDGGEPVANGTIFALLEGNATKASWKLGRTDEHGQYELILNEPGNYLVAGGENVSGDPPIEQFVYIPDVQEHELDLAYPEGSIEGTVTDANGDPVTDAEIKVTSNSPTMFALDGGRSAATDGRGRFAVQHLKPDTYVVRVIRKFRSTQAIRAGIVVLADRETTGVDFELGATGLLKVRVVDAERNGVPGATVFLRSEDGALLTESSRSVTGHDGRILIDNVFTGPATVVARKGARTSRESDPIEISASLEPEVELELQEGTLVTVTTLGTGGRPEITTLTVLDAEGRNWGSMRSWKELERLRDEGFSSSERRIGPLPRGEYEFVATDLNGRDVSRKLQVKGEAELSLTLQL